MKSRCRRGARGGGRRARERERERERGGEGRGGRDNDARCRRCAHEGRKRGEKDAKRSDGERKRFQLDSVHRGEVFSRPSARFAVAAHTFLRNELDYWLNPDRGITYSVKKVSSRGGGPGSGKQVRERTRRRRMRAHRCTPPNPLPLLSPFLVHVRREGCSQLYERASVRERPSGCG